MIHVLSLGAGVQSSTLALMAKHGEVMPMPTAAIFADTKRETRATYRHLAWLVDQLPFPVYRVTAGDLGAHVLAAAAGRPGRFDARPPFYISPAPDGGMLRRQCTQDYKLRPIRREIRRLAGIKARSRGPKAPVVVQWIGISVDEVHRIKMSGVRWIQNRWPLVEARMTRWDCQTWCVRHGYPIPPKSACKFCPYQSDGQWRELRDSPEEWEEVVVFDRAIRSSWSRVKLRGEVYVHRSCQPLDQVDLSTPEDHGQLTMFEEECEGMCGV